MPGDSPKIYLLDTSALIDMWEWYDNRVFPSFWKEIQKVFSSDRVFTIENVLNEITITPLLATEIRKCRKDFLTPMRAGEVGNVGNFQTRYPQLTHCGEKLNSADAYLLAVARARNWVLVHSEKEKDPRATAPYVNLHGACRMEGVHQCRPHQFVRGIAPDFRISL